MTLVAHLDATDYVSCGKSGTRTSARKASRSHERPRYSIHAFTCTDKTWQVIRPNERDSFKDILSADGRLWVDRPRRDDSSL